MREATKSDIAAWWVGDMAVRRLHATAVTCVLITDRYCILVLCQCLCGEVAVVS